jgi:hypothetical protein
MTIGTPPNARVRNARAWIAAALLLGLTLAVRLVPAWTLDNVVADVASEFERGQLVLHGDNLYAGEFPYTPLPQWFPAAALLVARATGWSFDFTFKLPLILADAATLLLLFWFLHSRGGRLRSTVGWCLLWALNPVAILVSSFHGNLSSILPFLLLGAYVAAEEAEVRPERRPLLIIAALTLGLAVAMRGFPVLFVPIFVLLRYRSIRGAAMFVALAAAPAVVNSAPYLLYSRDAFLHNVLSYHGLTDFGWLSVLRALSYLNGGPQLGDFDTSLLLQSRDIFLAAYAIGVAATSVFRSRSFGRALLLPPLLFYGLYGGISAQYLVWLIPLALAEREPLAILFTALATVAMVSFYVIYHPGILFGAFPILVAESRGVILLYALSNVALVVVCLGWSLLIIGREVRARIRATDVTTSPLPTPPRDGPRGARPHKIESLAEWLVGAARHLLPTLSPPQILAEACAHPRRVDRQQAHPLPEADRLPPADGAGGPVVPVAVSESRGDLPNISPGRRWLVLCFCATLAVYGAFLHRFLMYSSPPTGDQAWYLMVAISLVQDGDLDLHNNFDQRDEDKFYALAPHPEGFVGLSAPYPLPTNLAESRGRPANEWYNYHLPGLSILLIPSWVIGAWFSVWWPATVVFMCTVGALLAVQVFLLAYQVSDRLAVALGVWLAIAFSNPVMSYSYLLFSELPTGLLVLWVFRRLALGWNANGRWRRLLIGVCIGYIPWLAWRCTMLAGLLLAYALVQWWREARLPLPIPSGAQIWRRPVVGQRSKRAGVRALAWILLPVAVAAAAMMKYNLFVFGRLYASHIPPESVNGPLPFTAPWSSVESLGQYLRTGFALLFDETFGLLTYAPVYLLSAVGFIAMTRSARPGDRRLAAWIGVVAAPYMALIMAFQFWHGTWCPPARYQTTLVPLLAAPLAASLAGARKRWFGRAYWLLFGTLAVTGFALMAVMLYDPRFIWPFESAAVFRWLAESNGSPWPVDLRPALVSFLRPDEVRQPLQTGVLLTAAVGVVLFGAAAMAVPRGGPACERAARLRGLRHPFRTWAVALLVIGSVWFLANYEYLRHKTVLIEQRRWTLKPHLYDPRGIAWHAGKVYVTDYGERLGSGETLPGHVGMLDLASGSYGPFTPREGRRSVAWANPGDVKVGPDGRLWFLDNGRGTDAVYVVEPDGRLTGHFALPASTTVTKGLSFGPDGSVYVSDMVGGNVTRYARDLGSVLATYTGFKGGLNNPSGVFVDGESHVYTTEGFSWVQQLSPDGRLVRRYDVDSSPQYLTSAPGSDWIDVCTDRGFRSLHRRDGRVQLGRVGAGDLPLDGCRGLAYGPGETLYVLTGDTLIEYRVEH